MVKPSSLVIAFVFLYSAVLSPLFVPVFSQTKSPPTKLNIAILDFDARSPITPDEAAQLSDIFSAHLVGTGEFTVVDRSKVKDLLVEQGLQQSGVCSEVDCIVEVGRLLKVQRMFAGTVGKLGDTYTITVKIVDVSSSQIQMTKSRQLQGKIDLLATDVVPGLAAEFASDLTGKKITPQSMATSSSGWLWYVGGAVMLGGGAAAYIFLKPTDNKAVVNSDLPGVPKLPGQ